MAVVLDGNYMTVAEFNYSIVQYVHDQGIRVIPSVTDETVEYALTLVHNTEDIDDEIAAQSAEYLTELADEALDVFNDALSHLGKVAYLENSMLIVCDCGDTDE